MRRLSVELEAIMWFRTTGIQLLSVVALAASATAQTAPAPSAITRTVIAASKLPTVTDVPLYFRAVGVTLTPGEKSDALAANGILYQILGSTEILVGGETRMLTQRNSEFVLLQGIIYFPLMAISIGLGVLGVYARMTIQRLWQRDLCLGFSVQTMRQNGLRINAIRVLIHSIRFGGNFVVPVTFRQTRCIAVQEIENVLSHGIPRLLLRSPIFDLRLLSL